ncbi:MAG: tRNA-guanine transglycosylase [Pirellulaceae bacterium]
MRHAHAQWSQRLGLHLDGTLRLRNARHADDRRPIDEACPCLACRHSRAYLRHLFMAKEMLGPILLTHHNLTFYQQLMAEGAEADCGWYIFQVAAAAASDTWRSSRLGNTNLH